MVETPSLYPELTAAQNLALQNRVLGLPDDGNIPALLCLAGLEHTGAKKVRHFSLGMRQRLASPWPCAARRIFSCWTSR